MADLTPKQHAFCEFYISNGNASEAARLAGYSKKTSQQIGAENLLKPVVQEYIKSLTQTIASVRIATAIERQEFWTAIMRGQMPDVDSIQLKASEILGKAQGDFIQKVEVTSELTTLTDDELDAKIQSLMLVVGI